MNRHREKPRRSRIAFETRDHDGTDWYILSHRPITPDCPRGVWQMGIARYVRAQRIFIFFTCPHCGEIQRDFANYEQLRRLQPLIATKGHIAENAIRWCHRCRFCRGQLPYALDDMAAAVKEYEKLEEELDRAKEAARKVKASVGAT